MGLHIHCWEIGPNFQARLPGRTLILQPVVLFAVGPRTALVQHALPFLPCRGMALLLREASGVALLLKYSRLDRNPSISAQPLIFAFPNSAARNFGVIIEC